MRHNTHISLSPLHANPYLQTQSPLSVSLANVLTTLCSQGCKTRPLLQVSASSSR